MTYQEFDRWLVEQAETMPHLRGDRAAQAAAKGAQQQASGTATGYGQQAGGLYGPLTTFGEQMMTAPPGYGNALPGMVSTAGQVGSATAGTEEQKAALRAANTGNAAGLASNQDAIAQAAARGTGQNIQDILAQNAQLQQTQRTQGSDLLRGIYGTDVSAQLGAMGQQAPDINALTNAGKSGWLQNLTGILGLGQLSGKVGGIGVGVGG